MKPRRAVITGATSGIGRETARLLAEAGCELVLAARREERLEDVRREIGAIARRVQVVPCDVRDPEACGRVIVVAQEAGDHCTPVLVNCAGAAAFGPYAEVPLASVEEVLQVNLFGSAYMIHAILPWMLHAGAGQIINVLSMAAVHTLPGAGAYAASKAGLLALGRSVAADYRRQGVRVTAILPGAVDTPLWERMAFVPPQEDMLPVRAVAEAIRDVVLLPPDRSVDELLLMPPKGIL